MGVALLVVWFGWLAAPIPAAAHAALDESNPASNEIIPRAPETVTLRFTERLERSYSQASLFDQLGRELDGSQSRAGDDAYTMILDLPPELPNGTFSVLWRTLSMDDGHTAQGYFAFTIGTEVNVLSVVPPETIASGGSGPPEWLRAASRWLALLGLAATVAVWPIWLLVLRPAMAPVWQLGPIFTRRVRRLATWTVAAAIVANVVALLVQAAGVGGGEGFVAGLTTTLNETRFGTLWLVRIGLFLVFAAVLMTVAWWWPRRRPAAAVGALVMSVLLPLPFSLISHASAQPAGRATAVAADLLHLLAASLWAGGLLVLVAALGPLLRDLTPAGRRAVLARAIPRFSSLALIAWGVMGLTGLYSAWLQVGNLTALRETPYGQSLIVKLLLVVPLLGLAAFNLLLVTRRLRAARGERAATVWSGRFLGAIAAEAVLVVLVLLVVGRLTAQQPARDVLAQEAGQISILLDADGQQATLSIAPGAAGPNRYRLQLGSGHDHATGRVDAPVAAELRVELPDRDTGQKAIVLAEVGPNLFEADGSELGIAGDWEIETIVRQAGQADWRTTVTQELEAEAAASNVPGPPPRFGTAGIGGLLLVVVGIAGIVLAIQAGRSPLRRESAGLGTTALAIGAVLLVQAQVASDATVREVALAAPDAAAVDRGRALFSANCLACHGPGGQGDGPQAGALEPKPADLTAVHALAHPDADLFSWIANGIEGSAMPGFAGSLSDEQIGDLIAYVRGLQAGAAAAAVPAGAAECSIAPRSLDGIRTLAATPAMSPVASPAASPRATPVASPVVGAGAAPVPAAVVDDITATARELVACANAGDALRRLALFTDANVRDAFPAGPTAAFAAMAAAPSPVPEAGAVALLGVEEFRWVGSDRVSALVSIDNPRAHSHGPGGAEGGAGHERAVLVFKRGGERWLIDDVRR